MVTSAGITQARNARVKKRRGSGQVRPGRQQDVDDLAILVNGPVELGPRASDLHICLARRTTDHREHRRHGRAASMNSEVNRCTHR